MARTGRRYKELLEASERRHAEDLTEELVLHHPELFNQYIEFNPLRKIKIVPNIDGTYTAHIRDRKIEKHRRNHRYSLRPNPAQVKR